MPTTPLFRGGIFYLIITSDIMNKAKKRAYKRARKKLFTKWDKAHKLALIREYSRPLPSSELLF